MYLLMENPFKLCGSKKFDLWNRALNWFPISILPQANMWWSTNRDKEDAHDPTLPQPRGEIILLILGLIIPAGAWKKNRKKADVLDQSDVMEMEF